jgi:uncharacterized protein YxeA
MKRIVALVVAMLFTVSVVPAFAQTEAKKENNLIKIVMDSFKPWKPKEKNTLKNPLPTVTAFQNAADGIKEGSAKAKQTTLRTNSAK